MPTANVTRTIAMLLSSIVALEVPAGDRPAYTIEDLPNIGLFAIVTPHGINDAGLVVGRDLDDALVSRAIRWENGRPTQLDDTRETHSTATAISDNGIIVGFMDNPDGDTEAAMWDENGVTFLGIPPGDFGNQAWGVNDSGTVVGYTVDQTILEIAVMWVDGETIEIGGFDSVASDINNAGQIVGRHDVVEGRQALLWEDGRQIILPDWDSGLAAAVSISHNGTIVGAAHNPDDSRLHAVVWLGDEHQLIDLGLAGFLSTLAWDANDSGEIVGEGIIVVEPPITDAVLWVDGDPFRLDDLIDPGSGWDLQTATGINNAGQIIGLGLHQDLLGLRGFLLTPIAYDGIPGDLDGDGVVGTSDLLLLLGSWGRCATCDDCLADLNDDCVVGAPDLILLLGNWG